MKQTRMTVVPFLLVAAFAAQSGGAKKPKSTSWVDCKPQPGDAFAENFCHEFSNVFYKQEATIPHAHGFWNIKAMPKGDEVKISLNLDIIGNSSRSGSIIIRNYNHKQPMDAALDAASKVTTFMLFISP